MAQTHRDLVVWQLAERLRLEVYRLTDSGSVLRDFAFRAQLRDAASGISSNIVEGFRRVSAPEFARFLRYSYSGAGETEQRLHDGLSRGHWTESDLEPAARLIKRLDRGLVELLRYLQTPAAKLRSQEILNGQRSKPKSPKGNTVDPTPNEPVEPR